MRQCGRDSETLGSCVMVGKSIGRSASVWEGRQRSANFSPPIVRPQSFKRWYQESVSNVSLTTMCRGPVLNFQNVLARPGWSLHEIGGLKGTGLHSPTICSDSCSEVLNVKAMCV